MKKIFIEKVCFQEKKYLLYFIF